MGKYYLTTPQMQKEHSIHKNGLYNSAGNYLRSLQHPIMLGQKSV